MTRRSLHIWAALAGAVAFSAMAWLVQTGETTAFDVAGVRWIGGLRGPIANQIAVVTTQLGSGLFLAPFGILAAVLLYRKCGKRVAWTYFGSVLLGWGVYGILKASFARPRPDLIPRLSGAGWWSFPSGHAMSSTIVLGLAVLLLTRSVWIRISTALLILLIASSRVYLGVHYPSDVIAGIFAGCAWIAASKAILAVEEVVAEAVDAAVPG